VEVSSQRISLERIRNASLLIDPVFLNSPQYVCEPLGSLLETSLLLKIETLNPIRSFKGRGAELLVSRNLDRPLLICASAGNFGQAMAYSCRKRNTNLIVYAATTANPYKIERMKALGAEVILFGDDFDSAKEEAKRQSGIRGIPMVEDGLAVETVEGAGTIGTELQSAGPLDALLIPLGNGALFNGIATVFKALQPSVKMIAVQAAGAPAMVESWKSDKLMIKESVKTIADGIAVRIPIAQALDDMRPLVDEAIVVAEQSILNAIKLLHVHAGIVPEPSAAVGIAAILENQERFKGLRLATIICGGNLTEKQMKEWLN
jgi:threonine dehydratase